MDDRSTIYYRYLPTGGGGKPIVWVELAANEKRVEVPATLTPNFGRTRLSPRWAAAIDASEGQAVSIQFLRSDGSPFGRVTQVVPEFDSALDRALDDGLSVGAVVGDDWTRYEGIALGHDLLQHFVAIFVGNLALTILLDPHGEDEGD